LQCEEGDSEISGGGLSIEELSEEPKLQRGNLTAQSQQYLKMGQLSHLQFQTFYCNGAKTVPQPVNYRSNLRTDHESRLHCIPEKPIILLIERKPHRILVISTEQFQTC
jgi:hypothetical protein